jgi:transcriptional regulator of acetoin/glycerol metabolism
MRTNDDSAPPQSSVVDRIVPIHVGMSLRQAEELLTGATLQQTGGKVREAAKVLGIDRSTLRKDKVVRHRRIDP